MCSDHWDREIELVNWLKGAFNLKDGDPSQPSENLGGLKLGMTFIPPKLAL